MTRRTGLMTAGLCLWVSLSTMQGQQTPAPPLQTGASDQSQQPAPAAVDPKTGLPLTPAEQREKEIDKYDPMKREINPVAEDASPLTDREPPAALADPEAETEPLPGSVAASETGPVTSSRQFGAKSTQDSTGDAADDSETSGAVYSGPAVLTRSYTLSRPMMPRQIKWRISLGLSYSWDFGQTPAVENTNGSYPSTTTTSRTVNWGLSGRHLWKHDQLGLSYNGNYSLYSVGNLSGTNNTLNLDYAHAFSRHLAFQFVESLQDLSQNYSLENPALEPGSSAANINLATSPNLQLFENTVRQTSSTASVTYHQTSRLSYSLRASSFEIGRTGVGLVGTTGQQFGADVNYRWTRRATVGVYYSYTNYQYSHNVLQTDAHSQGLVYSYALNPRVQLRTRFGASRVESLGYEQVALPPELAAILGEGATIVNAYSLRWISDISVELVKDFRRNRTASLSYARGESPGNGLLLTSIQETISGGYEASFFRRRLPVSAGVIYSSLDATSQGNLGYYKSETVYFATSRPIGHGTSATFRVDYRHYDISGTPLLQHDLRISVGLGWSPPDNALRF